MGASYSRPYYTSTSTRRYYGPSECFIRCPGGPHGCYCSYPHADPRNVFMVPGYGGGRRRYMDPMQYIDRLNIQQNNYPGSGDVFANGPGGVGVGGMGGMGGANGMGGEFQGGMPGMQGAGMGGFGFPYGGYGGLGWKDPQDWTTRDFECLQEVFGEMLARQRGRRGRRGGGGDDYGYDNDRAGYGYGGSGRDRTNIRDLIALLEHYDTSRRLHGVERTVFGTPTEMRDAAFRQRLYSMFGSGGDRNDNNDAAGGGMGGLGGIGGGGGGNTGARFMQQQRDHERREREQRNLDCEVDEIQRHLERLRDQGDRAGGIGGAGPGGWRLVDEWLFG